MITSEEIKKNWKQDNSWYQNPQTNLWLRIGDRAKIGDEAEIGDRAEIGDEAEIGAWAKIGDRAKIGAWAEIGAWAKIGDRAKIGDGAKIGAEAKIGDGAEIGAGAKIGVKITSTQLNEMFRQNYIKSAPCHIFTKWVRKDRMSPGWGASRPILYPKGAIIEEPKAVISDQQCAIGLHVFRYGYDPRWTGLGELADELIPLDVKVMSEDICFAGLPGNDAKLRVRKLEVLT